MKTLVVMIMVFLRFSLVDCIGGRYGPTCGEDCGHCISNDVCDKSNGNCPRGCSAGYKGNTCKEGMPYTSFDLVN